MANLMINETMSPTGSVVGSVASIAAGIWIGKKIYEVRKRDAGKTGLFVPIICGVFGGGAVGSVAGLLTSKIV